MKKQLFCIWLVFILLCGFCHAEICANPAVDSFSKYGNIEMSISADDFEALGFELGDDVTVEIGSFRADMPYLDGFYVYTGEYLLRRNGEGELDACISHGNLNELVGASAGDPVRITLKEKAGSLAIQGTGALNYTDERGDYASDEIFANFRMLNIGNIGEGKIYRSASPVNNDRSRAADACALMEKAGIRAVMNLADSDAEIAEYAAAEDFDSAEYLKLYEGGQVIALDMDVNFRGEDFRQKLARGLSLLAELEGPYLLHCNEGKDRAGFASAVIAALMGASAEEIARDYMLSYENYYHMDPAADAERYALICEGNIMEMLRHIAGLEKDAGLENVDLVRAAEEYLLSCGMTEASIDKLRAKLLA